eukprot:4361767-Prymnesium_polylepis.1
MAMLCRLLLRLRGICRLHRCPRRTTTCERREGDRDGGGPTILCKRVPEGARVDGALPKRVQPQPRQEELRLMHRVCGRGEASSDGGRRAPFALGDDVERVTRGLRIEGLVAASACALTRGSLSADRLPPPPSSARTARPYLPITHGVEHGEAARRAPRGRRTRGHGGRRAARPHPDA